MNVESLSVSLLYKAEFSNMESAIEFWPLVQEALGKLEADEITLDAARNALLSSHGCATLLNYLQAGGSGIKQMDFSFRAPLLCYVAKLSAEDKGCDTIYDPTEAMVYIETDDAQYALPVIKDYRIDWRSLVDEVQDGYEAVVDEEWALDRLLKYVEIEVDSYKRQDDDL